MGEHKSRTWLLALAGAVLAALVVVPLLLVSVLSAFACGPEDGSGGGGDSGSPQAVVNSTYKPPEHSDDPVAEKMATFMEGVALDDSHGYSQPRRRGDPDYDCSSLVSYAGKSAGLQVPDYPFTTFTMGAVLMANGFQHLTWSGDYHNATRELKRGDVLVNPAAHTELYAGGGLFVGARHAYPGGIDDGRPGDQGHGEDQEIVISRYLDPGLTDVYRHDPNAHTTAAGSGDVTEASVSQCRMQETNGSPDVDAGDGTNASADQAKSIARRLVPSYFPGEDADKEFGCLVTMWTRESGWNLHAENPSSGAYGIPQSLPGSKMASVGPDWKTNASTQIKWGLQYIKGRYQTPCGAWSRWQQQGWY